MSDMLTQEKKHNPIQNGKLPLSFYNQCLICCLPGMDNFIGDLIAHLSSNEQKMETCVSNRLETFETPIKLSDLIWLEWGNELAVQLTRRYKPQLREKRVICRIHSYEVLDHIADEMDFSCIDDLIFVAPHIMSIFLARCPHVKDQVQRISVVPNGINLKRFTFADHCGGYNIAFLGSINHKKDPMVLMHAFRHIYRHDDRYRLHIAGAIQDERYHHAMVTYIANNDLHTGVKFHGPQKDVNDWLEDKHFIICSSLMEGHPVGLMEAMAKGLKPLIYKFPGADKLYPSHYLWANAEELLNRLTSRHDSREYSGFIHKYYSLETQADRFQQIIQDKKVIAFRPTHAVLPPEPATDGALVDGEFRWTFPASVFASQPISRYKVLLAESQKQLRQGKVSLCETTLKRAARIGNYSLTEAFKQLVGIYRSQENIIELRALWKRAALAAAGRGDLNHFCEFAYYSIYSENIFSSHPCYQYAQVDEDFIDANRMLAKSVPIARRNPTQVKGRDASGPIRVGFVLNGFSHTQSPIQLYLPLFEKVDRHRFGLYVYSRLGVDSLAAKTEDYALTVDRFRSAGADVRFPDQDLPPIDEINFLINAIQSDAIDILVFQTTYFVPQYGILAALRLAPLQCSISHQQPEYHPDIEMVFNAMGKSWIEEMQRVAPFPITITKPIGGQRHSRTDHGIPDDAIVAITVGREVYYNQKVFIEHVSRMLNSRQDLWYIAVGLSDSHRKQLSLDETGIGKRFVSPGFQDDVMAWLKMADIYVDSFPLSGGSTLVEAMVAGLPVLSFNDTIGAPFRLKDLSLAPAYCPPTRLLIPPGESRQWEAVFTNLIVDPNYRQSMSAQFRKFADNFSPERVAKQFFNALSGIYYQHNSQAKPA